MRRLQLPSIALVAVCTVAIAVQPASAVKRAITLTFDDVPASVLNDDPPPIPVPNYNLINADTVINATSCPFDDEDACMNYPANEDVPFVPQKSGSGPGNATFTGLNSEYTYSGGTIDLVVDFDGGGSPTRMQVTGASLLLLESGMYCPGDGHADDAPDSVRNDHLEEEDGDFDTAEECNPDYPTPGNPFEQPGEIATSIGSEFGSGGSIQAVLRRSDFNMNGASDISGTSINAVNWHFFITETTIDTDGTGSFEYDNPNAVLSSPADHDRSSYPERAGHNESDDGTDLDETTYFAGTFEPTGGTDEYQLSFPLYIPAYFNVNDIDDADPEEYIRIILRSVTDGVDAANATLDRGFLRATGTLGQTLLEGDINRDGKVDGLDVNIASLHLHRGKNHTHVQGNNEPHTEDQNVHAKYAVWDEGDADLNMIIELADIAIIAGNFGAGAGAGAGGGSGSSAVPEPTSLVLALFGITALIGRRRRA